MFFRRAMLKLSALAAGSFIALSAAPANALVYTWGKSAPVSSSYNCGTPAGTIICQVTFDNFKVRYDGTNWLFDSTTNGTGSIKFFNSSSTLAYTINQNDAQFVSSGVIPAALNNSTGFTLANINVTGLSQEYVTFLFENPATNSDYEVLSINRLDNPVNITNGAFPRPRPAFLSSNINGVAAPAPIGALALVPFISLLRKRRFINNTYSL